MAAEETLTVQDDSAELDALKAFLDQHKMRIFVVVVVALAAFLVVWFRTSSSLRNREEAAERMFNAQSEQDLLFVVEQHSSTPSAPFAMLRLAKAYYDQGNFEMAMARYEEFIRRYPGHELIGGSELGRIYCMEAMGRLEEALAAYRTFAQNYHFLRTQALVGQASCLEQLGRFDEARQIYEDFIAEDTESRWAPRMRELLDLCRRKAEAFESRGSQEAPQTFSFDAGTASPGGNIQAVYSDVERQGDAGKSE